MFRGFVLFTFLLLYWLQGHTNDLVFKSFPSIEAIHKNKLVKVIEGQDGFIWLATETNVYRFDAYDAISITELIKFKDLVLTEIKDIAIDFDNNLWILTGDNLLVFNQQTISTPKWYSAKFKAEKIIPLQQSTILITNTEVITFKNDKLTFTSFSPKPQTAPFAIKKYHIYTAPNKILIATKQALFIYNVTGVNLTQEIFDTSLEPFIWDIHVDHNDIMWLSTDNGIYKKEPEVKYWERFQPEGFPTIIKSISSDENHIWFASALHGLIGLDQSTGHWFANQHSEQTNSLKSNYLSDIFIDSNQLLWITTFEGDLIITDPRYSSLTWNSLCTQKKDIYHISSLDETLYMATEDGVVIKSSDQCQSIQTFQSLDGQLNGFIPTHVLPQSEQQIWIGSNQGIHLWNPINSSFVDFFITDQIDSVRFINQVNSNELLFGTSTALFLTHIRGKTTQELKFDQLSHINYFDSALLNNNYYLATNIGLFELTDDRQLVSVNDTNNHLNSMAILSIESINGLLVIGTRHNGLFSFNPIKKELIRLDTTENQLLNISNIIKANSHSIWITSNAGLTVYDFNFKAYSTINEQQGLFTNNFTNNSSHLHNGSLYFGTRSGVVGFNPNIVPNYQAINHLVLTSLKQFNVPVKVDNNDGSLLKKSLEHVEQITLNHTDLSISLKFSALNFTDPYNITYYYKLQGFDPIWSEVNAENRQATYTKLPSGVYQFQVKTDSKDFELNSPEIKSISIQVLPPPWFTWWALTGYALLILTTIYWYIQRKIKINQKMAAMLRIEVAEKTKELNIQKQTVESLLTKKNELFSNVSHEFRTPLTLILGPIKELLNKQVDTEDFKSLSMIKRNANRLLSLIEQLLQIARVSDFKKVRTIPQNAQIQVQSLVESFQHMAQSKKIHLQLIQNEPATIKVTEQFIDATMGNLVSNAIKYTQTGGSVIIKSKVIEGLLLLSVKDTGTGLTQEQQRDIFKRFKRLESHQAIEGIGIGLSVVEEVVKINDGVIKVVSEIGLGSEFTVCIPLSDVTVVNETKSISTLVNQLQAESLETSLIPTAEQTHSEDSSLNTVLVIEDNHDMREHIISIVGSQYNCIAAENGLKGVAAAIEHIPDIIISDVMMPEMDGFKVARVIRSDQRTSHIPLMLLTALHGTTNRIKGWRENVDAYMTKPFDRDELLIHLENMLNIRDILKTKAGQLVKQGQSITAALPKKDKEFIDDLIETIQLNYQDPILNRVKIASEMAVSDRQLQRKTKALIDQNPMDMLREFRLKKAKELLKDGYQVSQVADDCGFNSLSYFSQCFKARNGISPKQYQQT